MFLERPRVRFDGEVYFGKQILVTACNCDRNNWMGFMFDILRPDLNLLGPPGRGPGQPAQGGSA